ncbi:MAG: acetamidase/formamidase family protein [Deltaproteobacteria bacterium]|nr:acetamidase/formamidase family protein [Deltaproteobacteria bacterium]MBW2121027.1 acetamidase/formamidase family protein [Deltaproteobacteria bacterium]
MKRIPRERANHFLFDPRIPPQLVVEPGERFVIETEDNLSGFVTSGGSVPDMENLRPRTLREPPEFNPLGGPVFVEGATRGDLLAVHVEEVVPGEVGSTSIIPGVGPFSDSKRWPELDEAYAHMIRHIPGPSGTTRDGKAVFADGVVWDLRPFIGTIGVAPDREVPTSLYGQGRWGGNWDCRDIKEGSTLYLNCFHDGGLLFVGDVHGTQGDAEFSGVANETKAEVVLSCEIIRKKQISYPRIETPDSIIALFATRPLEDGVKTAITYLMEWMIEEYELSPREAYLRIATDPDFRVNIYQMVRVGWINYTVGAQYPKSHL